MFLFAIFSLLLIFHLVEAITELLSAKFVSLVFRLPRSLFLCYPCQCRCCGSILSLERLPFVWKTRKFRGEFEWSGSSRVKFSGKKSNTLRGITFFPFLPKQPKFSVPFVWFTNVRLHVERKRKIHRYKSIPFLLSVI